MATKLIVDTANVLFGVAAINAKQSFGSDEERAGLALHVSFQKIQKYFRKFKPDMLAFAFESSNNWRKSWTASDECISGNVYKSNRVKDSSMEPFFELMTSFRDVMTLHSSSICLAVDKCEGDDVIGAFVQMYANPNDEIIILSGDKDFIQLLKYPNVRLINPVTDKFRNEDPTDDKYYADIDFFLFEKCIRGDKGDWVHSAYPRVRIDKIRKAYEDDYERVQFMNEEWHVKDDEGNIAKTFRVGDLYEENKLLVDLEAQPEEIRKALFETIDHEVNNPGRYSNFHFLKFLGKYKLNNIAENIHQFTDMLNVNAVKSKNESHDLPEPIKAKASTFNKEESFNAERVQNLREEANAIEGLIKW